MELRATNEARSQRLREHQEWTLEKRRLELLRDTIQREANRLEQAATQAREQAEALANEAASEENQEQRLVTLGLMLDKYADHADQQLNALARRTPPGLVPVVVPADGPGPEARFLAAVRRLEQTERNAGASAVELVSGILEGKPETVKLLRLGGVAAWWLSLDGTRSGQAVWKSGELRFHPGLPEEHRAIVRAFAIVEGGAAPDWVVLPLNRVETK